MDPFDSMDPSDSMDSSDSMDPSDSMKARRTEHSSMVLLLGLN